MAPEEKAKELYLKFRIPNYCFAKAGMSSDWRKQASKKNALAAIDEIMNELSVIPYGIQYLCKIDYWEGVKIEIEKI